MCGGKRGIKRNLDGLTGFAVIIRNLCDSCAFFYQIEIGLDQFPALFIFLHPICIFKGILLDGDFPLTAFDVVFNRVSNSGDMLFQTFSAIFLTEEKLKRFAWTLNFAQDGILKVHLREGIDVLGDVLLGIDDDTGTSVRQMIQVVNNFLTDLSRAVGRQWQLRIHAKIRNQFLRGLRRKAGEQGRNGLGGRKVKRFNLFCKLLHCQIIRGELSLHGWSLIGEPWLNLTYPGDGFIHVTGSINNGSTGGQQEDV